MSVSEVAAVKVTVAVFDSSFVAEIDTVSEVDNEWDVVALGESLLLSLDDTDSDSLNDADSLDESDDVVVNDGERDGVPDRLDNDSDSVTVWVDDADSDAVIDIVNDIEPLRLPLKLTLTDSDLDCSCVALTEKEVVGGVDNDIVTECDVET